MKIDSSFILYLDSRLNHNSLIGCFVLQGQQEHSSSQGALPANYAERPCVVVDGDAVSLARQKYRKLQLKIRP
jgi:hypothetical protein